ncbi:putative addiction module antidote protein [Actinotignum sanguinis]|uniref:addiction module antidote protein n=1 Tax=Actinotignum sanguinis TaxID=1445614 RepID=UPI001F495B26|nr:addiction module antidote protein [Actinotignum sanguinis]MDY5148809.1 putative addiction module antidote protein [Actinotignum sanguinis]
MEIISSSLFDAWLDKLKDKHAQRRILYAIARCEAHGTMLGGTVMTKVTFSTFDASKYLDSQEAMNDYLAIALEDGDTKTVQVVLRDIARARGMSQLAKDTGLNRESLYKSLSKDGNPSFAAITKIMKALGLKITLATQNA